VCVCELCCVAVTLYSNCIFSFSAFTLLVGHQVGYLACKKICLKSLGGHSVNPEKFVEMGLCVFVCLFYAGELSESDEDEDSDDGTGNESPVTSHTDVSMSEDVESTGELDTSGSLTDSDVEPSKDEMLDETLPPASKSKKDPKKSTKNKKHKKHKKEKCDSKKKSGGKKLKTKKLKTKKLKSVK